MDPKGLVSKTQQGLLEQLVLKLEYSLEPSELLSLPRFSTSFSLV